MTSLPTPRGTVTERLLDALQRAPGSIDAGAPPQFALAHLDARRASHVVDRWGEGQTSLLGELPVREHNVVAAAR